MEKLVIVINGRGGVGKDTLCGIAGEVYKVQNYSSIDPIKQMARLVGWQGGKSAKSRKFLADLKELTANYNDYPTIYLLDRYRAFLASTDEILFVHIREGEQIQKFVDQVHSPCVTLLVRRGDCKQLGNLADDGVEDFNYDYIYENSDTLEETAEHFSKLLVTMREEHCMGGGTRADS